MGESTAVAFQRARTTVAGGAEGGAGRRPGTPPESREHSGPEAAESKPRYLVLGPLELRLEGRPCTPTALKSRALLALLLLRANQQSSTHSLIEDLWNGRPPRSALAALQMYVSGLRRILDPGHSRDGLDARHHPLLPTVGSGYLLRVGPGELDLDEFREQAALGRSRLAAGDCQAAEHAFRRALTLSRGTPLGDLTHADLPGFYGDRLAEEQLAVVQDRIGADICRGRAREVTGELRELCARYPLRETFHEQLMLALTATGRQTEALEVYAEARRTVVAAGGIEPGSALKAAQQAVLRVRPPLNAGHEYCRSILNAEQERLLPD
ncbi:AfsR/SARP family transcriptional regulator [Streptomyces sp. NPDC046203]|uniref:AfsR/SARP family transcriptional regulator n=1 Tax=Streptomyces sp. NPDC046203 TaxID=3154602 RepID=UPI0033CF57D6